MDLGMFSRFCQRWVPTKGGSTENVWQHATFPGPWGLFMACCNV